MITQPRRLRRVVGLDPVEAFVDIDSNDINSTSLLHITVDDNKKDVSNFEQGSIKEMLSKVFSMLYKKNEPSHLENFMTGYLLNQMSVKAGIKVYGKKAVTVLMAEFLQLDERETFMALDPMKFIKRQKRKALKALSVIKQKRDLSIKRGICANGQK